MAVNLSRYDYAGPRRSTSDELLDFLHNRVCQPGWRPSESIPISKEDKVKQDRAVTQRAAHDIGGQRTCAECGIVYDYHRQDNQSIMCPPCRLARKRRNDKERGLRKRAQGA